MTMRSLDKTFVARLMLTAGLAVMLFTVLAPADSTALARSKKIAIFGTAVEAPIDDQLRVATRHGVKVLVLTPKTKFDKKRGTIPLEELSAGDYVVGYYELDDGELVAKKLSFKKRKSRKIHDHLVGVVVDKDGDNITVQTTDGDEVEIEAPSTPEDDPTEEGSLVVTVVETDPETGDIDALGLRTAEETINRLNEAINQEITLAQEQILKIRMSDTASSHLTKLHQTLDEIHAEAQEKIEAAFAEFQANYNTTLDENLIDPPLIFVSGRVLDRTPESLVVARGGNGKRVFLIIDDQLEVTLLDGSSGTIFDVLRDDFVEVTALPQTQTTSPIARTLTVIPDPTAVAEDDSTQGGPTDETITGTIVLVDDGDGGNQQVIVVDNPDGSEEAAAVTDETEISGEEELEPGQEVEVTLGDDGFEADSVIVVSNTPEPDSTPTPDGGDSPSGDSFQLSGIIRSITDGTVVLDEVTLTIEGGTGDESFVAGDEIEFNLGTDGDSKPVITGIGSKGNGGSNSSDRSAHNR